MTLKNKNPWKYLSVGLLGVIAIGLFAPVQAAPGDALSGWQLAVAGIQAQINTIVGSDFQTQIDDVVSDLAVHEAADGDLSSTNEIQSLSEIDGVISLSDDGFVTVQDRVSSSCAVGSSIRAIAADGTVTCETIVQGGSLSLTIHQNTNDIPANSNTFAISICPSGVAVSGGYVDPDASPNILILQDNTSISSTAYVAEVHNFNNFEVEVTTFVRCLELVTPP